MPGLPQDTLGSHQWLVVVGIAVANAASMGGISQLSHLFLGETLPIRVRQMVGSAVSLYMGALSAIFIHLFPILTSVLGNAGLFLSLAGVNVLQVMFARCFLPETRGLSLEEVQKRHFSSKLRKEEEKMKKVGQERTEEEQKKLECGDIKLAMMSGKTLPDICETTAKNCTDKTRETVMTLKKEGLLNSAFEDTERGFRHRKISERTDEELKSDQSRTTPVTGNSTLLVEGETSASG